MSDKLAVVEKKPQRHGGCVGVFFQLFDWNRRFAKKKLFSKKLLPPDRMKDSSKKFGGDEKQAKIRLIADENKGGFPSVKNGGVVCTDFDQKHEMRVPGLVARLMGLETMPTMHRDKSKKVSFSGFGSGKGGKSVDKNASGSAVEELCPKKGVGVKHELRPPKLQKTSSSEKQAITKFGAGEKLPPFKNVLSKTRKHHHGHHPKLPIPVKSPKSGSSKSSSSRLIGAATRILEPGLQMNRSKGALTYRNHLKRPIQNDPVENGARSFPSQLGHCEGLNGQQCKNCGYLLDNNLDCKLMESEEPVVSASQFSHCVGLPCQEPEMNTSFYDQEFEEELPSEGYPPCAAATTIDVDNVQPHAKFSLYRNPLSDQIHKHYFGSQQGGDPSMDMPVSLGSNQKLCGDNHMLLHSRGNVIGTKRFAPLNHTLSGSTKLRGAVRKESNKFEPERRVPNRLSELAPPGRKRRPSNISRHAESSGLMDSTGDDYQNCDFPRSVSRKQLGYNACLMNRHRTRTGSMAGNGQTSNGPVLFGYSSSAKVKSDRREVFETRVRNDLHVDDAWQSAIGECNKRNTREKPFPLSGDALGALLAQKLKELTCQGEDNGGSTPRKTTATILHELISALTSELPFQQDNFPAASAGGNGLCYHSRPSDPTSLSKRQVSAMATNVCVDQQHDSEHLSPGSVLEAYFATESCPSSSSMDDCQGYKTLAESAEYTYRRQPNSENLDSLVSLKKPNNTNELALNILNSVSETLLSCKLANCELKGNNMDRAREVLSTAELAFHEESGRAFVIKHLLVDEIEALASVLWMNFGSSLGIEGGKEANQLTRFVFDSVIEHLSSRFGRYPKAMSGNWSLWTNGNMLIFEIVEAVRKWGEMSRYCLDEVIEREMSLSLGEWTRCDTEVFETGGAISQYLYQSLVDEVVMDLWNWWLN